MSQNAQRSFAAGELTPALWARTDLAKYLVGARTIRNFVVQRQGGVTNRGGTELVDRFGGTTVLLPFVYNDAQAYCLVFTDLAVTVVRDGGIVARGIPSPYRAADLATLQITQSADVLSITHANYPEQELKRFGDATWTLTPAIFKPTMPAPTNLVVLPAGVGLFISTWVVTAVSAETGEESYASTPAIGPSSTSTIQKTVAWDPVAGASEYRVYRAAFNGVLGGGYGYVGTVAAPATSFFDTGIIADAFAQPPAPRDLFAKAGDYASACGRYQQRAIRGGSLNAPETVWTSRVGNTRNYTVSRPLQDDDAVTFTPASKKVNLVRHFVDVAPLLVLTSGGAFVVGGDGAGALRPTDINVEQIPVPGAGELVPIVAGQRVVYQHARRSTVRAIALARGYQGEDLTLMASHLFDGHTLVAWAYQETPHSVLWCVRSDGVLLGCTMLASEDVLAWHRHDTDGFVESVCTIPEGTEDALYLVVNRNGARCLERMASSFIPGVTDMRDAIFLDSSLAYDGRNTSSETVTLTGGPRWTSDELLTVTRSVGGYTPAEIGNAVFITDDAGLEVRVTLRDYVSPTVMRGLPSVPVPVSLQNVARTTWSRAVDTVAGLDHLEGKAVTVLADGTVAANALNPRVPPLVVSGGTITLGRCAAVIRVGLPITADLATLDLEGPAGRSARDPKWLVNAATVYLEASRGVWAGSALPTGADPLAGLREVLVRDQSDGFGPIAPRTGAYDVGLEADWQRNGRMALRHIDPLPLTVSAIVPRGNFAP